jgi:hypothetical protein
MYGFLVLTKEGRIVVKFLSLAREKLASRENGGAAESTAQNF